MLNPFQPAAPLNVARNIKNVNLKIITVAVGGTATVPAGKCWGVVGYYHHSGASNGALTFNGYGFASAGANTTMYVTGLRRLVPNSGSSVYPCFIHTQPTGGSAGVAASWIANTQYYAICDAPYVFTMVAGQQVAAGATATVYILVDEFDAP